MRKIWVVVTGILCSVAQGAHAQSFEQCVLQVSQEVAAGVAVQSDINLHNHSFCSDGAHTPEDVVRLARQVGVRYLSITDHDTLGCLSRAKAAAGREGVQLIPGIEVSVGDDTMHLLGIGIDPENSAIKGLVARNLLAREVRARDIAEKLSRLSANGKPMSVTFEEIVAEKLKRNQSAGLQISISRPDIARTLVSKGYVRNIRSAFDLYLGDKAAGAVPLKGPPLQEAISAIHEAGGIAIMAHPYTIYKGKQFPIIVSGKSYPSFEPLMEDALKAGLDGFEQYKNRRGPTRWLVEAANRYGSQLGKQVLFTPGSDYHGADERGEAAGERELASIPIPKQEATKILSALHLSVK